MLYYESNEIIIFKTNYDYNIYKYRVMTLVYRFFLFFTVFFSY